MGHRQLIPILNSNTQDAAENPRLQRLKEKLSPFSFTTRWCAGKQLCIPDALFCHPVSAPTEENYMLSNVSAHLAVVVRAVHSLASPDTQQATTDMQLQELQQAATSSPHIVMSFTTLLDFWKIGDKLYCNGDLVFYGSCIVVPAAPRKSVLQCLHDSHHGAEAIKRRAKQ